MAEQIYLLDGDVTIETVPALLNEMLSKVRDGMESVDCSGIRQVDSSVLGLIFSCKREARKQNRALKLTNIPHGVQGLADLYGVAESLEA